MRNGLMPLGRWGLVGALATLALESGALAQDSGEKVPGGLLQLVPVPPLVGGGGPVDLYLVALNPDGTPANGLTLKATRTVGMASRWIEVGNGVYRMPYSPPAVDQPSLVTATAKGKLPTTGEKVSLMAGFQVVPAPARIGVVATPPALVLGRDAQSSLQIGGSARGVDLRTNVGTIADKTAMSDGSYAARYVPPKLNYPHVAIVAYADNGDPLGEYGHLVVPLHGNVEYPVKGAPGASVLLEIGDRKFGPVVLGADGKGKVPVEVPPGVQAATQVTVMNGGETREPLDLKIPETRRVVMYPLPEVLPADPGAAVPLRVVVVKPDGAPDTEAKPTFTVSAGSVNATIGGADGVYEATWTPPATAGPVEISVSLGNDVQVDQQKVTLGAPRPGALALDASVDEVRGDTATVDITAKLTDPSGAPMTGASLLFDLTGAEQVGQVVEVGGGEYKVTLKPVGAGPIDVRARLASAPSTEPVHGLLLVPGEPTVTSDGADSVDLLVASVDAQGLPVADVPVALEVIQGDGSVEARELVTGRDGTAHTRYEAGITPALVGIKGTTGEVVALTTLLQAPEGVAPIAVPTAPVAPSQVARFTTPPPSLTLPRAADAPVAAAPAPAPAPDPAPAPVVAAASIKLAADASSAAAGARIAVTASLLDADGKPVAGKPEIVVTGGAADAPVANPDGTVAVTVTVPDPATVPVIVTAKLGEVTQVLSIPVAQGPWSDAVAAGPVPDPAAAPAGAPVVVPAAVQTSPAPAPAPVAVAPAPRPAPSAGAPWMRARVSGMGSTYRYEQLPSADPGPLLPSKLAVGGPDGGSPAAPIGGELDVRAWGDDLGVPYVGAHGQFRVGSYGISASEFSAVARDVLMNFEVDLLGRYPFSVAGEQYWVGGKVGVHGNDFLLFEGCLDPGCQISTSPVNVVGLGVGAEIGADLGPAYLIGGYTLGLARGVQPYANALDVNVGYHFADPLFVDLGFGMLSRSIVLQGEDSGLERGSLADSQMMFKLGLGLAL